jgi:hypothetical protein
VDVQGFRKRGCLSIGGKPAGGANGLLPIRLENPLPFAIAAVPNAETGPGNPGHRHGCSLFEHMDTIEINYLHIVTLFLVESGHVLWRRYHTGHSLLYRARCYRNFDEMLNLMCWVR